MASLDHVLGAQTAASGFFNPMIGGLGGAVSVGGGAASSSGAFDIEDGKVVRCGLAFGRRWLTCDDTQIGGLSASDPSGIIFATVTHKSGDPTLSVSHRGGSDVPDSSLDATHRLLYKAEGGTWHDYRTAIVIPAMD